MAQLTWENMNPIDTSRYLDAIQKAQATSLAGVEQIGKAYQGYYDNLKKQNTNDMLTALNQAQNPEELAAAQANIAAMQQRWGSGYDMDSVRTAMDERPTVLMQRKSAEMDFKDKQANIAARPNVAAIYMSQLKSLGATDDQLTPIKEMADSGVDITTVADKLGQYLTNDRNFTNDNYWKLKNFNQSKEQFEKTHNQNVYEFIRTATREEQESAYRIGKGLYEADVASGAGTTYVAADGTEFTTGGGGGAAIANYASKFMPSGDRGIRNNNPGNIEFYNQPGATLESKGGRFARFSTPEQGLNAMSKQLDLYYTGKSRNVTKPINTIQDIITTWAPPKNKKGQVENDTAAYIAAVAKSMGVSPTAKLNLNDPNTKAALMSAMITQENGSNPYTREQYIAGITGKVGTAASASNNPAPAPMVGIDRKVQQKIRGEYQEAMLKYNQELALKDQPVNVGNVLAGLTAKEKGSFWTQDAFDIVNALKDNPQLAGLSAEGITNVYNRAKAWQSKPKAPLIGYNSSAGLKGSIDNFIKDELNNDIKRKEHVAKASHPSNLYVQKIQQEFEANGVSLSTKEALLHIDPARYESLYGKPTVKVQEAVEKKVEKVAATAKPDAKTSTATAATAAVATAAAKPKPEISVFSPVAKASKPASQPTPAKAAKPTKQEIVDFYIKRGKVDNVMPGRLDGHKDGDLIRQAKKEATEQLKAIEAKKKADKEAQKARERVELARVRKEYSELQKQKIANQRIKAAATSQAKEVDMDQLRKAFAQKQSLSISNAARKAKEEEERKRK